MRKKDEGEKVESVVFLPGDCRREGVLVDICVEVGNGGDIFEQAEWEKERREERSN